MRVTCPNCMGSLEVEDAVVGEILDCPDCGLTLRVKSVESGVEVEIAAEEEEDWGE
ncbi:MAG: lysine biosynthesis protein LysW [Candidatus Geothermarchaeales archaeon]